MMIFLQHTIDAEMSKIQIHLTVSLNSVAFCVIIKLVSFLIREYNYDMKTLENFMSFLRDSHINSLEILNQRTIVVPS